LKTMTNNLPAIIAALHLPRLPLGKLASMAAVEDYVCQNLSVFSEGGMPAVILQDESLNAATARPDTVAVMSALGRLARREFPQITLGIIVEAHDPVAPIAIAHACGASFVRIKVFVGAMLKSAGLRQGCGIDAVEYRHLIGREDIQIMADVHDREGHPLLPVPVTQAARWASNTGANALILTAKSYPESLNHLKTVRESDNRKPLYLGGGADAGNIDEVLNYADGVIVSSALKRDNARDDQLIQWDREKIARFMETVNNRR
jgi:uncharacterized protein